MKIETNLQPDHEIQLIAEIDEAVFEKYIQRAGREISKKVKFPGFRPGKVPFDVIRRQYGVEAIEQEAIELMVDDIYPEAITQADIKASGPGRLDKILSIHPPKFSFIIPLEPEVILGDYKSIRKDYHTEPVDANEEEKVLSNLQREFATAEPVAHPAQDGDLIYALISAKFSEPQEGESDELIRESPYQTVIGDQTTGNDSWPFPGFSEHLLGMSEGEEKVIDYSYPEDSNYEKLRGKNAKFTVKLQSVKALTLPEVNDDFARTIGNFETLDDLRKSIHTRLEETRQQEYDDLYFSAIIDEMVKQATIKYPPHLLEHEVEHSLEHLNEDLGRQKLDLDTYLKLRKVDHDTFIEEEVKPAARQRLESNLVLQKFAELEKIELSREELQAAVSDTLADLQGHPDLRKIKARREMENLANMVTYQTANKLLNDHILAQMKKIATGQADAPTEVSEDKPETSDSAPETTEA